MSDESQEIVHPKFRIRLRPDGIIHVVWGTAVPILLVDAVEATEAMAALTGGRRTPALVDVHDSGAFDRPARVEFVRRGDLMSAVALLVGSPLSRMMGNFFVRVDKPISPTRMFDDESSAVAWLQEFSR